MWNDKLERIRERLGIDRDNLDGELERFPEDFMEVAYLLESARVDLDYAVADLERVKAELEMDIRQNPEKYGITKVTEGAIKAVLTSHDRLGKLQQRVLSDKRVIAEAKAVRDALEAKKLALKALAELWVAGYWAEPKVRSEVEERARQRIQGKVADGLNKKLKTIEAKAKLKKGEGV